MDRLGLALSIVNPEIQMQMRGWRKESHEFTSSLGYIMRTPAFQNVGTVEVPRHDGNWSLKDW